MAEHIRHDDVDSVSDDLPIILLSGMAADERLFADQLARFPNLRILEWIEPHPRESIQGYAARMAGLVGKDRPCLIGGASFGGVVALEMAQHLPAVACLLIGSIRSPRELPWSLRRLRPIAFFGPGLIRALALIGVSLGKWFLSPVQIRRLRRLAAPESSFFRWSVCAFLTWKPSSSVNAIPIRQIHGSADEVLPVELTRPDVIVPGGMHALAMFSPVEVNQFIADVVREVRPQ